MTGFYFTIHISNSLINSAIIEVRCYQSFKDTESESKSQQGRLSPLHSVTLTSGSPSAVEISAMDFRVRLGKPEVHLEMTASERPIFLARSFWVMCFCLRRASIRAIMSAESCTSDIISGDTAAIFASNHSCLFLIMITIFRM